MTDKDEGVIKDALVELRVHATRQTSRNVIAPTTNTTTHRKTVAFLTPRFRRDSTTHITPTPYRHTPLTHTQLPQLL